MQVLNVVNLYSELANNNKNVTSQIGMKNLCIFSVEKDKTNGNI